MGVRSLVTDRHLRRLAVKGCQLEPCSHFSPISFLFHLFLSFEQGSVVVVRLQAFDSDYDDI